MKRFAVFTLAFILAASPVWAGTYFKARIVNNDGTYDSVSNTETWVEGDQFKIHSDSQQNGSRVLITNDGGQTMYVINPSEKTYSKYDFQGMIDMISAVRSELPYSITDQKSEILAKEPGPEILGMPTTHIMSRRSYAFTIKVAFVKKKDRVEIITDLWITGAAKLTSAFFDKLNTQDLGFTSASGSSELDALLKEGLILKSESIKTTGIRRTKTSRSTMEITELDVDFDIPEGTFEIPSEYTLVEAPLSTSEDNPFKGMFNRP